MMMNFSNVSTAALLAVAVTGFAQADGFTLGAGTTGADPSSIDVSGLLVTTPGTTYTSYSASMFGWADAGGFNWSSDEIWALTDQPFDPINGFDPSTVFYLDPGASPDGANFDYGPTDLTWSGFFDLPYDGSAPLYFTTSGYGDFASYDSFDIEFGTDVPVAPAATDLGALGGMIMTEEALSPAGVNWYTFDTAGGDVSIDTAGSILTDAGFGENDTELGLYDSTGLLIADNDDVGGGDLTSAVDATLAAGTYYVAVGSFNTVFGASAWDVSSTSTAEGTIKLTIVPEPASAGLLVAGALAVASRRRRRA